MASLVPLKVPFFDDNANFLVSGKLYTYQAGTTTPLATYTDYTGNTANANPIILNGRGECNLWVTAGSAYKFVLKTSADAIIWTQDNVTTGDVDDMIFLQAGTGAVQRSAQSKMRESYSLFDFMTAAQIADVQGNTALVDVTAAIQAALDAAHTYKVGLVIAPQGTYLTGTINWPGNNIALRGNGSAYSYNSSATPRTVFKAKAGTSIVFDLVQTGLAEDRTGNHICDLEIDGASIAAVGIDMSGANIVERVRVQRCSNGGIRLSNFTNSSRIINCGLNQNSGYGLQVEGASTTTYSVEGSFLSLNTLGGANIEAGVRVKFSNSVFESNDGPGLRMYKPNSHTNAFMGFEFDSCWFEDNASDSPNFTLSIGAGTSDPAYGVAYTTFKNCHVSVANNANKLMSITVGKWITFKDCTLSNSTASDAITLASNAQYVAFIESCESGILTGVSATQVDNAIAQGAFCYSSDKSIKRAVSSFSNSWENYGDPFCAAKYWFDDQGRVHLQGSIKLGAIGSAAFTLPVGYRPLKQKAFAVDSNGAHGLLYVGTDGTVTPYVGSNTIFNLDGCFFAVQD